MLKNLIKQIQNRAEDFKKTDDYKKISDGAVKVKEMGIEYFNIAKKEVLNAKNEFFDKVNTKEDSKINEVEENIHKKEKDTGPIKNTDTKKTPSKTKKPEQKKKNTVEGLVDNSKRKMLSDTNLNKNIVAALNKNDYVYLDQIENLKDEELSSIKGVGPKSVEAIRGFLDIYLESRRVNSKT